MQQRLPHRPPLPGGDGRGAGHGEHAGLLEQLARGGDHAGSLRGAEGFPTVHGHAGILDVHAPAWKSVEAAGKLELVAAADPKHVSAFADEDYGGCRPDAGHSIDSLARTCMIP